MNQLIKKTVRFKTDEEITIVADAYGDPKNQPILLLHGGGQTRHSWKKTGERLAEAGWYVVATDSRGHGESSWSKKKNYRFDFLADDLISIAKKFDKKPVLIGASMGGLTSIIALDRYPDLASTLILVDVSPKLEKKGVDRIFDFMSAKPEGYASLQEVQDAIIAYLPQRKNAPRGKANIKGLQKNLRRLPNGNWGWHWDPEMLNVWMSLSNHRDPSEMSDLLNTVLRDLSIPALLVRGGMSDVVSKEIVQELLQSAPNLAYVDVKDAGHMVAGDSNDVFTDALLTFLNKVDIN